MRSADTDRAQASTCRGEKRLTCRRNHRWSHVYGFFRAPSLGGLFERVGLGSDADRVEQRDRTRGSRCGSEGFETVLGCVRREAFDNWNSASRALSDNKPEQRVEHVLAKQRIVDRMQSKADPGATILGDMQSRERDSAGERRADVDEVPVSIGARSDHGV